MRLLHTAHLTFKDFFTEQLPVYAILSHRWEQDEVSYEEYVTRTKDGRHFGGNTPDWVPRGYDKILSFCKLALVEGYEWCWIDTCCIDKRSSAELTEAINSMFKWYKKAAVCYAYLSDVPYDAPFGGTAFAESNWFARGWTLQELLAPNVVIFCDSSWSCFGSKENLAATIAKVTCISISALTTSASVGEHSVAQRMSWASQRITTRIEDQAYCLLGMFDVSMPLLYGEGQKAFMRLQIEIMNKSNDESIFAWLPSNTPVSSDSKQYWGMLAPSPVCFQLSGTVCRRDHPSSFPTPYGFTNRGIRLETNRVLRRHADEWTSTSPIFHFLPLACKMDKVEPECCAFLTSRSAVEWMVYQIYICLECSPHGNYARHFERQKGRFAHLLGPSPIAGWSVLKRKKINMFAHPLKDPKKSVTRAWGSWPEHLKLDEIGTVYVRQPGV